MISKSIKTMTNIAIFASGNGSNCENIIQYFAGSTDIKVAVVVSNRPDAFALARAARHGIPSAVLSKEDFNNEGRLCSLLDKYEIGFIVLAGFLLMIPPFLVRRYRQRMVNIHPSLLPKFGGKGMYGHHVHEAVKKAGEKQSGITIHYVSEDCDGGDIIAQYDTPLSPDDTPEDIADKVHTLEMRYFPKVIERILRGGQAISLIST